MKRAPLVLAGTAAIALIVAAAFVGEPISISRAFSDPSSLDHAILFRARLPRIALGGIAGGMDDTRMNWLYETFTEKTLTTLEPAADAPQQADASQAKKL